MEKIYLDHNATTYIHPEVREAMIRAIDIFGNSSSIHRSGQEARLLIEQSRKIIASSIGCEPDQIIFTGSGTEASNIAIQGALCRSECCHLVVSQIEHPAVLLTARAMERKGYRVTYLPVTQNGTVELASLEKALAKDTCLVSIMHANNETGVLQDIHAIASLCREKGILFHTDAVQSLGKVPLKVGDNIDFLSASAHKVYGPKGVGFIFVRDKTTLESIFFGGGHEFGLRPGTHATINIAAFAEAVRICCENQQEEEQRQKELISVMKDKLQEIEGISFNTPENALPNTLNVSIKGLNGETLLTELDSKGFSVSTASACASGNVNPSHVLTAMGMDRATVLSSLRISTGRSSTKEHITLFSEALKSIISELRGFSSTWKMENIN